MSTKETYLVDCVCSVCQRTLTKPFGAYECESIWLVTPHPIGGRSLDKDYIENWIPQVDGVCEGSLKTPELILL